MLITTKEFKQTCSKILSAIDTSEISSFTDTLSLKVIDNFLYLSVTNKEYYISIKFPLEETEKFKATVNANLFLKLISQITTEEIELKLDTNYINLKANGNYKLPLIFENDKLMELPEIKIENKMVEMNIASELLDSITTYNSKELLKLKEINVKPIQKLYYIDQDGCITFTSGACVNSFKLEKNVKFLVSNKIVKLFKLFKNSNIKFTLGYDPLGSIIQTKLSLISDTVELTAILASDDTLLNSLPSTVIRSKVNAVYPYSVVLSKDALVQALNRLTLFNKNLGLKNSKFVFNPESLIIYDNNGDNNEVLKYQNDSYISTSYTINLNTNDFKYILDGCSEDYVTLNFGSNDSLVVVRNNVKNILPIVA